MNKVLELFGHPVNAANSEWRAIVVNQDCPFLEGKCYKTRKSTPADAIGTCTVLYGKPPGPTLICPARLLERRQIFTDCLHLLTTHEPGNELHIIPEIAVPGGSVDYFVVSVRDGRVKDFVGVELQTLDTSGTVWPERQRLLRQLGILIDDDAVLSRKPFGMNWKMTAKTALVQMHHKIKTFEHVNKKLVLVLQDCLLDYMQREFAFSHLRLNAPVGDSMHLHSYRIEEHNNRYRLTLDARCSTDASGVAICLGLQAQASVELDDIIMTLEQKISPQTLFTPL